MEGSEKHEGKKIKFGIFYHQISKLQSYGNSDNMALVDIEKLTTGTKQKAQKKAEIDISWRRFLKVSGKMTSYL